jgi:hypothetical protein
VYTIALTAKKSFAAIQHLENRDNIQKANGIPNWLNTENAIVFPASISHHGRFMRVVVLG